MVHVFLIIGFGLIAVVLPTLILNVRRTTATYALVGVIWCVFVAGILAILRELHGRGDLDVIDLLRLAAVSLFVVFLLTYNRGSPQ